MRLIYFLRWIRSGRKVAWKYYKWIAAGRVVIIKGCDVLWPQNFIMTEVTYIRACGADGYMHKWSVPMFNAVPMLAGKSLDQFKRELLENYHQQIEDRIKTACEMLEAEERGLGAV